MSRGMMGLQLPSRHAHELQSQGLEVGGITVVKSVMSILISYDVNGRVVQAQNFWKTDFEL